MKAASTPPADDAPQYLIQEDLALISDSFPNGFPDDLNRLTDPQEFALQKIGAVRILNFFGKIKGMRPVISSEEHDEIEAGVENALANGIVDPDSPELGPLVFDRREAALLDAIRKFIATEGDTDREIIIVFGEGHNLDNYFSPNPKQYKHISTTDANY